MRAETGRRNRGITVADWVRLCAGGDPGHPGQSSNTNTIFVEGHGLCLADTRDTHRVSPTPTRLLTELLNDQPPTLKRIGDLSAH